MPDMIYNQTISEPHSITDLDYGECLDAMRRYLKPLTKLEVSRMADFNPTVWGEYRGMGDGA